MLRKIFLIFILAILCYSIGFAQYGKIAGRVVDRETKEPLIGANVIIVGTTLGAATDMEGRYVILNVPPGVYDVRASYVGYQDETKRGIRVIAGLTAEVNFELPSTAIVAEPVVVIAERPLIEKSATNAIRVIKSEDFEKLPVRGLGAYIALQPGVVFQDGRFHIRGGRADETGFILEGANVRNVVSRDGGQLVSVIPDALEEVLIQAGGYNAEFGGANAGLVQQNFKTGTEKFKGSVRIETDNFGNYPGKKFLGTYSYGYSDYVLSVSGPVFTNRIRAFLVGENFFIRDYRPAFWYGSPERWSDGAPVDTVYDTGRRLGDPREFQILKWTPGNIIGRFQNRYTFNGTLLFDLKPLYIRTAGSFTWQRTRLRGQHLIGLFNLERLPLFDENNLFLNVKATYFFTAKSFIEVNLNYLERRFKQYDRHFKDNLFAYMDSARAAEYGWRFRRYTIAPAQYDFYGFPFDRPGTPATGYAKGKQGYYGGSVALTSQVGRHEFKLGGSFERWTVRNYSISLGRIAAVYSFIRSSPEYARNVDSLIKVIRRNFVNNFGYDELGREINSGVNRPKHPFFASAYIQDKIEFDDIIINAGIRFDHIDMDSWKYVDPTRPVRDENNYVIPDTSITKGRKFTYALPRLGFSFPVTDRTVFHLQYGKFVQAPGLDVAYRGMGIAVQQLIGGFYFSDPIAFDLEPTRTTQYEIGFTQQFTDYAAFDITAFYKDIRGQVQYGFVRTAAGWDPSSYPVYVNQDFATTKGIEFRLTLRRVARVQAQVNYTLSDSRGTNAFPNSAGGALNVTGVAPTIIIPLTYDQRHRGSVILDYRFGKGDGGPILERLGINVLFTFNSGHRFTRAKVPGLGQQDAWTGGILNDSDSRQRVPVEPINTSTTPWNFNVDLRIDKTVTIFNVDFNFYAYVQNLFNTRNVINVYYATGNAYDDGFLTTEDGQRVVNTIGQRFADLYRVINLQNRQHNIILNGFDLFGSPRQIRVGVLVEF
ncbi:MAG: TonB-dependent receptor [Candidatus Kryptonium sp.]|nr:TonB-dependent receptor [Candidatus Kryptonium sp.]MDW8108095.1 TonB-dependent receptor [Candidatus Kryptonium sp.]